VSGRDDCHVHVMSCADRGFKAVNKRTKELLMQEQQTGLRIFPLPSAKVQCANVRVNSRTYGSARTSYNRRYRSLT
jgi:hypothetical protein